MRNPMHFLPSTAWCTTRRLKKPFGHFELGHVAMKFGDTYKQARFGAAHVKLESPVAWRYGGLVYESVRSEFFLTGYGKHRTSR